MFIDDLRACQCHTSQSKVISANLVELLEVAKKVRFLEDSTGRPWRATRAPLDDLHKILAECEENAVAVSMNGASLLSTVFGEIPAAVTKTLIRMVLESRCGRTSGS